MNVSVRTHVACSHKRTQAYSRSDSDEQKTSRHNYIQFVNLNPKHQWR